MLDETEELPPLWALDKAANLAGWNNWQAVLDNTNSLELRPSIRAHARTIAKYEPAPDRDKREREELARLFRAVGAWAHHDMACRVPHGPAVAAAIAEYKAILKERGL